MLRGFVFLSAALVAVVVASPSRATQYDPITGQPLVVNAIRSMDASPVPKETVAYSGHDAPGSIIVNTTERRLYFVLGDGKALRYGIGVGRDGFQWSGTHAVTAKREWPGWTPPPEMLRRQPTLPRFMAGGPNNPLGARAMYIGSTIYRIHGTSEPWTIGQAVSSGCIRMTNDDVIDLYGRVRVGSRVTVLR